MLPIQKIRKLIYLSCSLALLLVIASGTGLCKFAPIDEGGEAFLAHKYQGDRLLLKGKYEKSIEAYKEALKLDPQNTKTYFNLAIAHYSLRNIKPAAAALEKLVAIDPSDVEAQYNLACLHLYLRNITQAKTYFAQAKQHSANAPEFKHLINSAIDFVNDLQDSDVSTRDITQFFLAFGPAPNNSRQLNGLFLKTDIHWLYIFRH